MLTPIAALPRTTERGFTNVFRLTNGNDRTAEVMARHLREELGKGRAIDAARVMLDAIHKAAVTALHVLENGRYRQIAEVGRGDPLAADIGTRRFRHCG